jgi:hypothetical protein
VYFTTEQNEEYTRLAKLQVQIVHDIVPKRVRANEAMYDRILPEFAPKVLRYWELKPRAPEDLPLDELRELMDLMKYFERLREQILEAAAKAETSAGDYSEK